MAGGRIPQGLQRRVATGVTYGVLPAHRVTIATLTDTVAWAVALVFATLARYDFNPDRVTWLGVLTIIPLAGLMQLVAGLTSGIYFGQFRVGSFDEAVALPRTVLIATTGLFLIDRFTVSPHLVPQSAVIGASIPAVMLMAAARWSYRLLSESLKRPDADTSRRILVFGAGEGGQQVVTSMLRDPRSPFMPVALLDDHPSKRNLRIAGVRVMGTRMRMAEIAKTCNAEGLLIAIPSADGDLIADLTMLATDAGLFVKVLPPVRSLFGEEVDVVDIRDVTEADLLGRRRIETDIDAIAGYVTGKRVLVTGAGGSIGSELCRQLARFGPAELIMVDRDESALHGVQLSIEGRALLDSPDLVLIDIRDRIGLGRLFDRRKPEVVFHAAALKHLPLLENHPGEAVKTNVWGTLALLEVAAASGVERFVNISTDKAADPISVLGYSKRICERLTAHFAAETGRPFLSVRFGNVLGSRGSMLHTFHQQVSDGGPITVTDPDVTRYFMTIEEAVELVIQAGAIGDRGEALVLDMGQPVRIDEVARMLAARAPRRIDIVYTGLRPGEKMHEALLGFGEDDVRPIHPLISHVGVPSLEPHLVQELNPLAECEDTVELLQRFAGVVDARVGNGAVGLQSLRRAP